jgi:hypothetical protein
MLRLLKFLKPFVFHIILAVILLFIMANADLALPDYLSRMQFQKPSARSRWNACSSS